MNPTSNELMLTCLAAHGSPAHMVFRGTATIEQVKAAFVLRGTTLNSWSKSQGVDSSHVSKAVKGIRKGSKARKLLADVIQAVGRIVQ